MDASTRLTRDTEEGFFDLELLNFFGAPEPVERYTRLGYHPDYHIIFPFTQQRISKFVDGEPRAAPSPKGMSGSPIWNLCNDRGILRPVLGGLATDYKSKERVLVGTRIQHILPMIRELEEEATDNPPSPSTGNLR